QTEVLFGEALRQAAHASGQRWAVIASADMSSRLSPAMPWAQCARAACFDESFIEYLRAGDLRSAVGLEAHLADAAAEGLLQCTAVAAGAVAFRTRGHKQFGDDES